MNLRRTSVLLGAAVLALTGCSSGGTAADTAAPTADGAAGGSLEALYEAAIAAGETHAIGYVPNAADQQGLLDAFHEQFPEIEIELVSLFGANLKSRLEAETLTGGIEADFTTTGATELVGWDPTWLQPFVPETAEGLDDLYLGIENRWTTPAVSIQGAIFNTTNLPEDLQPQDWEGIVNPGLAGRAVSSPASSPGGFTQGTMLAYENGYIDDAWLDKLGALSPTQLASTTEAVQYVATGQADVFLVGNYQGYTAAKNKGAPLGFSFLGDETVAVATTFALFDGAGSGNAAAKLFGSWLFTPEAQAEYLEAGWQGTMPGAPRLEGLTNFSIVPNEVLASDFVAWQERLATYLPA